ncbi:MAG: Ig-like domain-containing protein [Prevotellaceae bacterium]|nr:Ig-like domain-containing protein [Prevotellaceae bacterium]
MMKSILISLFVLIATTASALDKKTITVNGATREYLQYVPQGIEKNRPLLISCHGSGQGPDFQADYMKIENVCDTARFITVFPKGNNLQWDISGNGDIDFILALIDKMHEEYKIDRGRVYLSGFSMGGMLTYHAMNKIADKIAAFAPISGYPMGGMQFTSLRPIPIIHTHGTSDSVVPFDRVQSFIDGWVKRNNCPTTPEVTEKYRGADHITRYEYGPGDDGVKVVLMKLAGKDHFVSNDKGVYTGDEIWKFCKNYSIDMSAPNLELTSPTATQRTILFNAADAKASVNVIAKASANRGEMKSVSLYVNDELIDTKTSAPYEWTIDNLAAGTTALKLIAEDTEGNKKELNRNVNIENVSDELRLDYDFKTENTMPAGWSCWDGEELRHGPSEGYYLGTRLFKMTGAVRDFDMGLYGRNKTGKEGDGWMRFGDDGSSACLVIGEGKYEFRTLAANWSNDGPVIFRALNADTDEVLAEQTITPTCNIGNKASNSFSGSSHVVLPFSVTSPTRVIIEVVLNVAIYGDVMLSDISIKSIDDTGISIIEMPESDDSSYYNLRGMKTSVNSKGVYIHKGRKYTK